MKVLESRKSFNTLMINILKYIITYQSVISSFLKLQSNGSRMFAPQLSGNLSTSGSRSRLKIDTEKSQYKRTYWFRWIVICTTSSKHLQLSAVSFFFFKTYLIFTGVFSKDLKHRQFFASFYYGNWFSATNTLFLNLAHMPTQKWQRDNCRSSF